MSPGKMWLAVCLQALLAAVPDEAGAETIGGRVRDVSGGAVAAAQIVLTTPELTVVAAASTDAEGRFAIFGSTLAAS